MSLDVSLPPPSRLGTIRVSGVQGRGEPALGGDEPGVLPKPSCKRLDGIVPVLECERGVNGRDTDARPCGDLTHGRVHARFAEAQRSDLIAESEGVIHLAFVHDFTDFAASCVKDKVAIETLGSVLAGSNRPLIASSGATAITASFRS